MPSTAIALLLTATEPRTNPESLAVADSTSAATSSLAQK
jgi:hypothetical protein